MVCDPLGQEGACISGSPAFFCANFGSFSQQRNCLSVVWHLHSRNGYTGPCRCEHEGRGTLYFCLPGLGWSAPHLSSLVWRSGGRRVEFLQCLLSADSSLLLVTWLNAAHPQWYFLRETPQLTPFPQAHQAECPAPHWVPLCLPCVIMCNSRLRSRPGRQGTCLSVSRPTP